MLRSMFSGVSGLRSHQTMMDVIGNNIANVNTVGYKSANVIFQDLLSQVIRGAGIADQDPNGAGGTNPAQVGLGVTIAGISSNFTQGASQLTGRATDLSIQGDGFFVVVGGRRAVIDLAEPVHGPGIQQQRGHELRLSGAAVSHHYHVPDARRVKDLHKCYPRIRQMISMYRSIYPSILRSIQSMD